MALDPETDPLFSSKRDLLGNEPTKRTYRALADLTEDNTYKLLSFLRFAEWDGDMMVLAQAKMRDEKSRGVQPDSDSDDEQVKSYKAENISVLSISNERRVLQRIRCLCEDNLKHYPNSLAEDEEALRQDEEGAAPLSFNQRNCVLFRKGEKEILHWFLRFSEFVDRVLSLKFKEAKKATAVLPKDMECARDYFQTAIVPLILKEQSAGAQ